jgi:hypothetical protein
MTRDSGPRRVLHSPCNRRSSSEQERARRILMPVAYSTLAHRLRRLGVDAVMQNDLLLRQGSFLRTQSKKFSSTVTCTDPFSPGASSGKENTTNRFPSGARSRLTVPV